MAAIWSGKTAAIDQQGGGGYMSRFFDLDNAFYRFMTKVCNVCILSLLWLVCSLPVFTIGASTAAVNAVMLRMVKDEEGYLFRSFFKALVQNYKQATIIWLLFLAGFIVIGCDVIFFTRVGIWPGILGAGLFFSVLLLLILTLIVVFHHLAWYAQPLKITIVNSVRMALGYLPYSISLLVLMAVMGYGIYVSVPLMIIFFFFGMGIFSYISAYLWRRVFDKLENEKQTYAITVKEE